MYKVLGYRLESIKILPRRAYSLPRRTAMPIRLTLALIFTTLLAAGCAKSDKAAHDHPGLPKPPPGSSSMEAALTSGTDLWGEEALKQPGGPSYEYF